MSEAALRSRAEPSRAPIPGSLLRPLGRGYFHADGFLSDYLRPERHENNAAPDASMSLRYLEGIPDIAIHLRSLRAGPRCLIEGYSTPSNGAALRGFLERHGVQAPVVLAFDLIDVAGLCGRLGIRLHDVELRVADASDLRDHYGTRSMDMVMQDHLLNCSPPALHDRIVSEMARVLQPGGLAIVNYTDSTGFLADGAVTRQERAVIGRLMQRPDAYCVQDLIEEDDELEVLRALGGRSVSVRGIPGCILVTAPYGNFEFYRPIEEVVLLLEQHGMAIIAATHSTGKDSNGNLCTRHRLLARRL